MDRAIAHDSATVVFIDLAGFSAISDVYGDSTAIAMLEIFEGMVGTALEDFSCSPFPTRISLSRRLADCCRHAGRTRACL
jgi:GGDEF domain-containing protein